MHTIYLEQKFETFPKRQILDSSKLKEFADDICKFDENGSKFSKRIENTVGKGEITHEQFLLSHSVFKSIMLQTRRNKDLFGKELSNDKGRPACFEQANIHQNLLQINILTLFQTTNLILFLN